MSKQSAISEYGSEIRTTEMDLNLSHSQACALLKVYDRGIGSLSHAEQDEFVGALREVKLGLTLPEVLS